MACHSGKLRKPELNSFSIPSAAQLIAEPKVALSLRCEHDLIHMAVCGGRLGLSKALAEFEIALNQACWFVHKQQARGSKPAGRKLISPMASSSY